MALVAAVWRDRLLPLHTISIHCISPKDNWSSMLINSRKERLFFVNYEEHLEARQLSKNTIRSYLSTAHLLDELCPEITRKTLISFKNTLVERYAPASVNQKIQATNSYLDFLQLENLKIRPIKSAAQKYLQASLTLTEYEHLSSWLAGNGLHTYHFAIRIMAGTGVRVSELMNLSVEDARRGYGDVYGKGGKLRRVYFPAGLRSELERWVRNDKPERMLMLNRFGAPLSARGLSSQLKVYARKSGLDPAVIHPHAFRHLFARQFLAHGGNIALLADLLGHSSLETTRIYLRQTVDEQKEHIDKLVCW